MVKKQKLELTWIGKEERPTLEPRILLEDRELSYHAKYRVKIGSREDAKARISEKPEPKPFADFASSREMEGGDIFDNRLIFGGYYRLAPSLLEKDRWGNWVINQTYNAAMLAEALCKLEGFTYVPSDTIYWQHDHSTEQDFIYITTAHLTHEHLQELASEVGPERSLLVLCTAFRGRDDYANLTVKKIPRQVLSRCEWGHDDYSLKVENLPQKPVEPGQLSLFDLEGKR
jgi:hypothetical protein